MYVYHDEPLPGVSHQELHDAVNGLRSYLESEDFLKDIAERLLHYWIFAMARADEHAQQRKMRMKVNEQYDALFERFRIAQDVLEKHGLLDEYSERWMGKEDERNNRVEEPERT